MWEYNTKKSVQDNCSDFEQEVYREIQERMRMQEKISLSDEDVDFSRMEIIDTAINKDWFPHIAPITYVRVGETIYTWCPMENRELICEELQMWD